MEHNYPVAMDGPAAILFGSVLGCEAGRGGRGELTVHDAGERERDNCLFGPPPLSLSLPLSAIPSFAPQTQLGWAGAGGGAETRVAIRHPNETTGECNAFDRRVAISSPVLLQRSIDITHPMLKIWCRCLQFELHSWHNLISCPAVDSRGYESTTYVYTNYFRVPNEKLLRLPSIFGSGQRGGRRNDRDRLGCSSDFFSLVDWHL